MRHMTATILALMLSLPAAGAKASERLVADLSQYQIAITSQFTGAEIILFGVVEGAPEIAEEEEDAPRDIAVIVRGPLADVTVRRKERVAGIWINRSAVRFMEVPGFYFVASTRPLADIASEATRARLAMGLDQLGVPAQPETAEPDMVAEFHAAMIRNKKQDQLFIEEPGGVVFRGASLFRASVPLPAHVPVGHYQVEVYLLREGAVVNAQTSRLFIDKSGLERDIYRMANDRPLLYGIMAVLLAAVAGWTASLIFRPRGG
jgi:uncharacterized protein (TIGR02186 family)